jgi:hypothetical protein
MSVFNESSFLDDLLLVLGSPGTKTFEPGSI